MERPSAIDRITVLLADDNLIVREGVRALLGRDSSLEVIGVAADYDEVVRQALALRPQVLVTDIRMPPTFQDEGIEAAREVRARLPGTGVVVLSAFDDPEYAVELLADGADGYAYLLKDHVSDAALLGQAIRKVAAGGSVLDPAIVQELLSPARRSRRAARSSPSRRREPSRPRRSTRRSSGSSSISRAGRAQAAKAR